MNAWLLTLLLLLTQQPGQLGRDHKPTRYKPGYTYRTNCYETATLLSWERMYNGLHRWKVRYEAMGQTYVGYTDDEWIDLHTNKAFYNARTNQIVYYDSVVIIPRKGVPIKGAKQ